MTIANWNPNLTIPPGSSNASLNGYLTIPFAGAAATPPINLGNVFASGSQNGMTSSSTGQSWPLYSSPNPASDFYSVIWSASYSAWFAMGQNGGTPSTTYVMTSTDGKIWTNTGTVPGSNFRALCAIGSTLYAVASVSSATPTATSSNGGVTWTTRGNLGTGPGVSLCAMGGTAVVSVSQVAQPSSILSTSDGITTTNAAPSSTTIVNQPQSLCVTAGLFVILAQDSSSGVRSIYTSPTGLLNSWTNFAAPSGWGSKILSTIAGNGAGTWIIAALDGSCSYSTNNMATWISMSALANRPFRINYSKSLGLFVLVGVNGFGAIRVTSNPATGWTTPASVGTGTQTFYDLGAKDPF